MAFFKKLMGGRNKDKIAEKTKTPEKVEQAPAPDEDGGVTHL